MPIIGRHGLDDNPKIPSSVEVRVLGGANGTVHEHEYDPMDARDFFCDLDFFIHSLTRTICSTYRSLRQWRWAALSYCRRYASAPSARLLSTVNRSTSGRPSRNCGETRTHIWRALKRAAILSSQIVTGRSSRVASANVTSPEFSQAL